MRTLNDRTSLYSDTELWEMGIDPAGLCACLDVSIEVNAYDEEFRVCDNCGDHERKATSW